MSNMPLLIQLTSTFSIVNTYMSQIKEISSNTFDENLSVKNNIARSYTPAELFANENCLTLPTGLYEIELELPFATTVSYMYDIKVAGSFEVKRNETIIDLLYQSKSLPKETDKISQDELAKDSAEAGRRRIITLKPKSSIFEVKNQNDKIQFRFFNIMISPVQMFQHGTPISFNNAKLKIYQL